MTGVVRRVNGPLVEIDGLAGPAMAELVEVGPDRLPAEVVAIDGDRVVAQAYEYTGGLRPGAPVYPVGRPLSARLGPGLLGGAFDGLLRPLHTAPTWLSPDRVSPVDTRSWTFDPVRPVPATVAPGDLLGTVTDAGPVPHRVLVPTGVAGALDRLAPAGRCAVPARTGSAWPRASRC